MADTTVALQFAHAAAAEREVQSHNEVIRAEVGVGHLHVGGQCNLPSVAGPRSLPNRRLPTLCKRRKGRGGGQRYECALFYPDTCCVGDSVLTIGSIADSSQRMT